MTTEPDARSVLSRLRMAALGIGMIAALPTLVGAVFQPTLFFPAYLVGILFWWAIATGCLALSLLHHLTGGGWGQAIRRPLEAGSETLPLVAILFLPVLFGLPYLYLWARPDVVLEDSILQQKAAYLNVDFFRIRAVVYFVIWSVLAWITNRLTRRVHMRDSSPSSRETSRNWLLGLCGPGMILWTLTVTFAAIDWTMSLEPHWLSSIHGLIFMAGQAVSALGFVLMSVIFLKEMTENEKNGNAIREICEELTPSRQYDLGNLLMAFTLFWSYVSFTQFLVIWSGNLPEETRWYLQRERGGWQFVTLALIAFHFVVPFILLLRKENKQNSTILFRVAGLLLVMRWVEYYWQVFPTFSEFALSGNWLLLTSFMAIGGLWLAAFISVLGAVPEIYPPRSSSTEVHAS